MAEVRRPRVAMVTDAIGPYHHGGKEQRYLEIAPRLTEWADVDVYTMHWWKGGPTRQADGVTYRAICPALPLYSGGRRSIRQALVFSLACLRLLWAPFDVIEADHMPYFQLITLKLVALIRRRRLIVTWHEYWGFDYWRTYLGPAGIVGGIVEAISTRLPDGIIAASPQTAERLKLVVRPSLRIVTAPNGVDLERISAITPAASASDLIVVGRLLPHKRLDLLLEAVSRLRGRGVLLTVSVVGSGPEADSIHALSERLGLAGQIRFEADIRDQRDLFAHIKAARAAVFPSEREGFGIAVLEALACGVPVVTTSAPDNLAQHLLDRAGSAGIVCAPDPDSLADAILAAITDSPPSAVADTAWLAQYDWASIASVVGSALIGEAAVDSVVGLSSSAP